MVIDGIFLLKVIVEVKVLDVNDNSLVCEKILYLDIIFEDVFFGKLIMQIFVIDVDICFNVEIIYMLLGLGVEKFKLNLDIGELKMLIFFDCEE